jgi:outer membrane protein assembly factor BamA
LGLTNKFATYTTGFLDWTLERVSPEILRDTSAALTTLNALRTEEQPQFNSILTFTLQRDKTNDIFSPTDGFFNSITLEESGILPKMLSRQRSESLPFTEYYKMTVLGKWFHDISTTRFNILALKLESGFQSKYGESKYVDVQIPLTRRFFSGGGNSVRGWQAHELGAMSNDLVEYGGNFLVEGSVEMRVNHLRGLGKFLFIEMDKIWNAYYLDFGNTWSDITDFKPKEIAIAAGFGFRYETAFGPFRIDYGFRVYDPKEPAGHQTIFKKRFFGETFSGGVLHFGIGQSF